MKRILRSALLGFSTTLACSLSLLGCGSSSSGGGGAAPGPSGGTPPANPAPAPSAPATPQPAPSTPSTPATPGVPSTPSTPSVPSPPPSTAPAVIVTPPIQPEDMSNPTHVLGAGTPASVQAAIDAGELQAAVDANPAGGVVKVVFDGGSAPYTLTVSDEIVIRSYTPGGPYVAAAPIADVVIDGGGLVTLDGQQQTRIFRKNAYWLRPEARFVLQNITLTRGSIRNAGSGDWMFDHSGAAVYSEHQGRVHLINVRFLANEATEVGYDHGGAVFVRNNAELIVSGCTFEGNIAANGAGITTLNSDLLVFNSVFRNNRALGLGGDGLYGAGGDGGLGGAISVDGVDESGTQDLLQLAGCVFENNQANHMGGGVYAVLRPGFPGSTIIEKCSFTGNRVIAGEPGGNIQAQDQGQGYGDNGGGLYLLNGTLQMDDTLFANNTCDWLGGGLLLALNTSGNAIRNCTFVGNSVTLPAGAVPPLIVAGSFGGGLFLEGSGQLALEHCTVADNSAANQGGGVFIDGTPGQLNVSLKNCILAENMAGQREHNINFAAAGGGSNNLQFPQNGDPLVTPDPASVTLHGQDPLLGSLGFHGGPTQTLPIGSGSPARDAGDTSGAANTDQRGTSRDTQPDIGAYEHN